MTSLEDKRRRSGCMPETFPYRDAYHAKEQTMHQGLYAFTRYFSLPRLMASARRRMPSKNAQPSRGTTLLVESLEDRTVPSSLNVLSESGNITETGLVTGQDVIGDPLSYTLNNTFPFGINQPGFNQQRPLVLYSTSSSATYSLQSEVGNSFIDVLLGLFPNSITDNVEATATVSLRIDPGPGEKVGDPVLVQVTDSTGQSSYSGGPTVTATASATASLTPFTPSGGSGVFIAHIGDTIGASVDLNYMINAPTLDYMGQFEDFSADAAANLTYTLTHIWTGEGSTDTWSDAGNWLGNVVPTPGSNIVFPADAQQQTNVNDLGYTFNSVQFQGGNYDISGQTLSTTGVLDFQQGSTELDCSTTTAGPTTIETNASLTVGNDATFNVLNTDPFNINGNYSVLGGCTANLDGEVSVASGAQVSMAGTCNVEANATVNAAGTETFANGSTLNAYANANVNLQANATASFNGTATFNPSSTLHLLPSSTVTSSGSLTMQSQSNWMVDAGAMWTNKSGSNATIHANFTNSGTCEVDGNATIYAEDGSIVTLNGFLDCSKGGSYDMTAAYGSNNTSLFIGAQGKAVVGGGGTLDFGVNTKVKGVSVGASIIDMPGGQISILGTVSGFVSIFEGDGIAVATGGVLDVSGTLTVRSGGSVDVNGSLIIEPGAALSITGSVTIESGATYIPRGTVTVGQTGVLNIFSLTILTLTLPNWTVNAAGYNQTILSAGGTGPVTFTMTGGTLPAGLTASANGVVTGTPTATGAFTFVITVTDTSGDMTSATYTINISPAISFSTSSLAWTVGAPCSKAIGITGGTGSLLFSSAGTLPPGLTLSSKGVVGGTPVTAGTYSFTVMVTDSADASVAQTFTVTINNAVFIVTTTLPPWTMGIAGYNQSISSGGGTGSEQFTTTGSLPAGLTFSSTGILTGTPTAIGTYTFPVKVTDSVGASTTGGVTITINPPVTLANLITLATVSNGLNVNPYGGLIEDSSGDLFGTATGGRYNTGGQVFRIPKGGAAVTSLASFSAFTSPYAAAPYGGVIEDSNGNLFGTTHVGGTTGFGEGTIFEVKSGTAGYVTLASFGYSAYPMAGLIEDGSGNLFGTTTYGTGTIFEWVKASGTISVLANMTGTTGYDPVGGLVMDSIGNLFGTASQGGMYGDGTVFEVAAASQTLMPIASFDGTDGANPQDTLYEDSSGNLFGTTANGGASNAGTVFEIAQGSNTITTLASFDTTNRANPYGGVIADVSGNLFGTTEAGGAFGDGTVFELQKGSGTITTLLSFNGTDGANPYDSVIEDGNGDLYGTTWAGGPSNGGTVFEFLPTTLSGTVGTLFSKTIGAAGGTAPITYVITSGILPPGLTLSGSGILSGSPTTTGSFNFTVTATDEVGSSTSLTFTMTISSPAPSGFVVTVPGASTVPAGHSFLVAIQAADSSGNAITTYGGPATITATISPSNSGSSSPVMVSINSSGLGLFLADITQVGSYTISVSGGSISGTSSPITVVPGAPMQVQFAAQPANTPTGVVLPPVIAEIADMYGNVVSTDNSDVVTLSVATGPSGFVRGSTLSAPVVNGVATFSNLTLAAPGTYQLGAEIPGLYTGPVSAAFAIFPLQVTPGSFVGTPSGFSLQFNTPFLIGSMTPALYGTGFGGNAAVAPTVTLTQTSGSPPNGTRLPYKVPGSLIVSQATSGFIFVETDTATIVNSGTPLLPDGTYVVNISSSGANGLQAQDKGGGYLDGTNSGTPGHDFTATFTVGAGAAGDDVVWVPTTADGPGQPLSAPGKNQAGGGYPVYLDDQTGNVTDVQATLSYNPNLLSLTPSSTANFTVTVPAPGTAVLHYNGLALDVGTNTPIGFINATVPAGTPSKPTPYKAKDLLRLSGISLNGGSIPAVGGDAVHLVAYVGDADGNGSYTSNDAVLITRTLLSTDSGFTAYPLVDPIIVADTDGSGFIPADAALQANEAGTGLPTAALTTPPVPPGVVFQVISNNQDPPFSIARNFRIAADRAIPVPANNDEARPAVSTGSIRGHTMLMGNSQLFTVSAADPGSLLGVVDGSNWTVDQSTGQIAIALSPSNDMPIASIFGRRRRGRPQ